MSGACLFPSNVCSKIPFLFPSTLCPENVQTTDLIRENRNFSASRSCSQFLKLLCVKLPGSEFCVDNDRETFPSVQETSDKHFVLPVAIQTECSQSNAYNHFTQRKEIHQMRLKKVTMSQSQHGRTLIKRQLLSGLFWFFL